MSVRVIERHAGSRPFDHSSSAAVDSRRRATRHDGGDGDQRTSTEPEDDTVLPPPLVADAIVDGAAGRRARDRTDAAEAGAGRDGAAPSGDGDRRGRRPSGSS